MDHNDASRRICFFVFLIVLVTFVSGQVDYSQADLEAMTEVELENICVQRGFQLVNDESDELTKQDYVEAARRCLTIEQEMNELLEQYPELADELEEEIKRMENENSEKQAHVEELEIDRSNKENSTDDHAEDLGMAFVRPVKGGGSEVDDNIGDELEEDDLVINDEVDLNGETDYHPSADSEEEDSMEETNLPDISSDNMLLDEGIEQEDATDSVGKNIETRESSAKKEDLTLTHIAIESLRVLVKNAQDDVQRIINLAIPVLQPIFNAGDAAWRQMKALFVRAHEVYEAYQAVNTPSSERTGESETCDDSVNTS